MCLILFSINAHPNYRYVFAANRDEFYERPTAPAHSWESAGKIVAGTDLKSGGTWMGISPAGRIAAITNFREPSSYKKNAPSRGYLVLDFLTGKNSPENYLKSVQEKGHLYNGFNLLVGGKEGLFYYSNRGQGHEKAQEQGILKITPGIHGISNHSLDTPWPKVKNGKQALKNILEKNESIDPEEIFALLSDRTHAPENLLPETGLSLDWERRLSSIFIASDIYGTRSSTILLWDKNDTITFIERTRRPDGKQPEKEDTRVFILKIGEREAIEQ